MVLSLAGYVAALASTPDELLYTSAREMPALLNPAWTGESGRLRIRAAGRLQWVNTEVRPRGYAGVADMPVTFLKQRLGVGAKLLWQRDGRFTTVQTSMMLSWRKGLFGGEIGVGIQGGWMNVVYKDSLANEEKGRKPNIGVGVTYTRGNVKAGVAFVHIGSPKVNFACDTTAGTPLLYARLPQTAYFDISGNIPLKNTLFILHPSFMAATDFRKFSSVTSMGISYKKMISASLNWRWKNSVGMTVGGTFKEITLGYSIARTGASPLFRKAWSHELMAGYDISLPGREKNRRKLRSIRIM